MNAKEQLLQVDAPIVVGRVKVPALVAAKEVQPVLVVQVVHQLVQTLARMSVLLHAQEDVRATAQENAPMDVRVVANHLVLESVKVNVAQLAQEVVRMTAKVVAKMDARPDVQLLAAGVAQSNALVNALGDANGNVPGHAQIVVTTIAQ